MSGRRVTRLSVSCGVLLVALDVALTGGLSLFFETGFVWICVGAALAVRPADFFRIGVLPPLLMLGLVTATAIGHRDWVARADESLIQAVVSGLTHQAGALLVGYLAALVVLAVRVHVRRHGSRATRSRTARGSAVDYSKREGSPAPTRTTSATPLDRSTTVVGSDPHSPESMTASTQ